MVGRCGPNLFSCTQLAQTLLHPFQVIHTPQMMENPAILMLTLMGAPEMVPFLEPLQSSEIQIYKHYVERLALTGEVLAFVAHRLSSLRFFKLIPTRVARLFGTRACWGQTTP